MSCMLICVKLIRIVQMLYCTRWKSGGKRGRFKPNGEIESHGWPQVNGLRFNWINFIHLTEFNLSVHPRAFILFTHIRFFWHWYWGFLQPTLTGLASRCSSCCWMNFTKIESWHCCSSFPPYLALVYKNSVISCSTWSWSNFCLYLPIYRNHSLANQAEAKHLSDTLGTSCSFLADAVFCIFYQSWESFHNWKV